MRLTFLVSLAGMILLFATLWKYEMASKHASMQLKTLRRRLLGDESERDALPTGGRSAAPTAL
jgi:heme exporter protein C